VRIIGVVVVAALDAEVKNMDKDVKVGGLGPLRSDYGGTRARC